LALFGKKSQVSPLFCRQDFIGCNPLCKYVFHRQGGWSWSIPYLAGIYALAAQVKPDIAPEEFWSTALATGRTIQIEHNGREYQFGVIADPLALIEAIKSDQNRKSCEALP
jgi:hypothetical protein